MAETPFQVYMLSLLKKYGVLSLNDIPPNLLLLENPQSCKDFRDRHIEEENCTSVLSESNHGKVRFLPEKPPDILPEGYYWYGITVSYMGLKKNNFLKMTKQVCDLFKDDIVLVFVPYCYDDSGEDTYILPIVESVIFVAAPKLKAHNFEDVREHGMFSSFVTKSKGVPEIFSCERIQKVYSKIYSLVMRKFPLGSKVKILSGPHQSLVGTVIGHTGQNCHFVEIKFLSTVAVVTIESLFLDIVGVHYEDPFELLNMAYISHSGILNDLF